MGLEYNSNGPNMLFFPKPSYWSQTFLSTPGTVVPIFLQPWDLATCMLGGLISNNLGKSPLASNSWVNRKALAWHAFMTEPYSFIKYQTSPWLKTQVLLPNFSQKTISKFNFMWAHSWMVLQSIFGCNFCYFYPLWANYCENWHNASPKMARNDQFGTKLRIFTPAH